VMMLNHGTKGSRKNKLVILDVETPGRKGVKSHEYLDIPKFWPMAGRDASASRMVRYLRASPYGVGHDSGCPASAF
jgi:hypothetical protein